MRADSQQIAGADVRLQAGSRMNCPGKGAQCLQRGIHDRTFHPGKDTRATAPGRV